MVIHGGGAGFFPSKAKQIIALFKGEIRTDA